MLFVVWKEKVVPPKVTTFNLVISRPHDPRVHSKAPRHETWTTRNRVGWWIFFSQGVSSFREDVHLWGRVTLKYFHIWKRKSTFFLKNVKIQMLASYLYKFKLRLQRRSLITGIFYSTNHHSPFGDSVFQVTRLSLPILSPSTHHQLDHQSCEVSQFPVMIEKLELKAQAVVVFLETCDWSNKRRIWYLSSWAYTTRRHYVAPKFGKTLSLCNTLPCRKHHTN